MINGYKAAFAPAGTSPFVITHLYTAILKAMTVLEVVERIAADGSEAMASTPEQFAAHIGRDIPKWAKVIKESGARAD